jgi:hypothetical protein
MSDAHVTDTSSFDAIQIVSDDLSVTQLWKEVNAHLSSRIRVLSNEQLMRRPRHLWARSIY